MRIAVAGPLAPDAPDGEGVDNVFSLWFVIPFEIKFKLG